MCLDKMCHFVVVFVVVAWEVSASNVVCTAVCARVPENNAHASYPPDLIPEICNPTSVADGLVSRLKSQPLAPRQDRRTLSKRSSGNYGTFACKVGKKEGRHPNKTLLSTVLRFRKLEGKRRYFETCYLLEMSSWGSHHTLLSLLLRWEFLLPYHLLRILFPKTAVVLLCLT